jgi:hypothetical protein
MAEPILLNLPPSDPRETLYKRLENAPHETCRGTSSSASHVTSDLPHRQTLGLRYTS